MPVILIVLFLLSVVPIALSWSSALTRFREFGHFDNAYPRVQQAAQSGVGARLVAAQKNSWETLLTFVVVVVIAQASPLPLEQFSSVSLLFLGLRMLYLVCYVANWPWIRSSVFAAGMVCCLYILAQASMSFE